MANREILVEQSDHRCGFTIMEAWKYHADYYFASREDTEEFIKELQKSIERTWPVDSY